MYLNVSNVNDVVKVLNKHRNVINNHAKCLSYFRKCCLGLAFSTTGLLLLLISTCKDVDKLERDVANLKGELEHQKTEKPGNEEA